MPLRATISDRPCSDHPIGRIPGTVVPLSRPPGFSVPVGVPKGVADGAKLLVTPRIEVIAATPETRQELLLLKIPLDLASINVNRASPLGQQNRLGPSYPP